MSRHRAEPRPRYGRIAVLGSSLGVTAIAVLGGAGVLPSSADDRTTPAASVSQAQDPASDPATTASPTPTPSPTPDPAALAEPSEPSDPEQQPEPTADTSLPADAGSGKRIVFSESRQRVWLMDDDETVRTYLVSGSVYDNLEPGTFEVFSRSEEATGIEDSGTMKYFVRFTRGETGAAIGFHDIPVDDGELVQTAAQLGTPLSHGCIRQRRDDAVALWDFAPIGTTVVVTA